MTALSAHIENGSIILDDRLPDDFPTGKVWVLIAPHKDGENLRVDPWTAAAMESAFGSDEDWGNSLDGLIDTEPQA